MLFQDRKEYHLCIDILLHYFCKTFASILLCRSALLYRAHRRQADSGLALRRYYKGCSMYCSSKSIAAYWVFASLACLTTLPPKHYVLPEASSLFSMNKLMFTNWLSHKFICVMVKNLF